MGIHLPSQPRQVEGITLQTACQHGDRDHQQQPIDPLRFPQTAAGQLEDAGFLIAEQLLAAEALRVAPDQIQRGLSVADQVPGLVHRQAGGMGKQEIDRLGAIGPEPHLAKATTFPTAQPESAHLTAQRGWGAVDLGVA